jgi:hypothetical protein
VTIKLKLNLSNEIENIKLKEYIPSSWEVIKISKNAILKKSTNQYNIIEYSLSGKNFDLFYKLKSPDVSIRPENYKFKTNLGSYDIEENTVQVYKIIPLPIKLKINPAKYTNNPKKFSKVSKTLPLISQDKNLTVALYSKTLLQSESLELQNFTSLYFFNKKFDYLKSYQIQTTLNSTEYKKIIMEYKINKNFLEKNDYKEITFFEKYKGKLLKITGAVVSLNGNEIRYKFESDKESSEIFILAEKNHLTILDKIINFLHKLKFWQKHTLN